MPQKVCSEDLEAGVLQYLRDLQESQKEVLEHFYEECITQMLSDPDLTDEQKQELLRQLELPDDEWEPIELPEGAEPISETIIKMRRGE